jgi:FmdE, Molybdenum formylmethanofuran dehydrogenase operon
MGVLHRIGAFLEARLWLAPRNEDVCARHKSRHFEVRSAAKPRETHNIIAALVFLALTTPALTHPGHSPVEDRSTENRDYWIERGVQIHGGFGSLIALGIRIGDDAMRVLQAERRELDVSYTSGKTAPCPCVADGIMVVTMASPGQGTLRVAAEPAEEGVYGRAVFRHRKTGKAVEYIIPYGVTPLIGAANSAPLDVRWSLIMDAPEESLFTRRFIKASN